VTNRPSGESHPTNDPSAPAPEEAGGAPQPVPRTGVAAADSAADRLGELAQAPLDEHVEIYEDVHRRLQEGLADLDEQ